MSSRIVALVMATLLALYVIAVFRLALALIGSGDGIVVTIGIALLVLPIIGTWVLVSELVFVVRGQRLLRVLEAEGSLPLEEVPRLASGRIDPQLAYAQFPRYQEAVQADPGSWRDWLCLALAYDASGDRRRARWAARKAIALNRKQASPD